MSIEKTTTSEKTAIGLAHSKLILIGEHAVVHGQPAIAIPFPLIGVETIIEKISGATKIDSAFYHGGLEDAPVPLQGIVKCIRKTLSHLNLGCQGLLIRISSSVPPGKGLGSSASVAISVIRSLFSFANKTYTNKELLDLANIAETHAHGAPSGIDALTITSDSPVWYEKKKPIDYIRLKEDFHFIVADSGRIGDTKSSVESVAQLLKSAPKRMQRKLERLGRLTHEVRHSLEKASKQLLGYLLNEAQDELETLGVSDTGLNHLVNEARRQGALGAKLTGGGNGGCIIALAKDEVHSRYLAEKLRKGGAHAAWPFVLKKYDDTIKDKGEHE